MSTTAAVPSSAADQPTRPFWREALDPYAQPRLSRSVRGPRDLGGAVPRLCRSRCTCRSTSRYLLVLALAVPAAGFLLRTYIVFHDCAHGSFLPSKRANAWLGHRARGARLRAVPSWRHNHAVHHATAGDLDRRGTGDVPTLTVAEYQARVVARAGSATGCSATRW